MQQAAKDNFPANDSISLQDATERPGHSERRDNKLRILSGSRDLVIATESYLIPRIIAEVLGIPSSANLSILAGIDQRANRAKSKDTDLAQEDAEPPKRTKSSRYAKQLTNQRPIIQQSVVDLGGVVGNDVG